MSGNLYSYFLATFRIRMPLDWWSIALVFPSYVILELFLILMYFFSNFVCFGLVFDVKGCGLKRHSYGFNSYSRIISYFLVLVTRRWAALSSTTKRFNTRFPLFTLVHAGYSVNIYKKHFHLKYKKKKKQLIFFFITTAYIKCLEFIIKIHISIEPVTRDTASMKTKSNFDRSLNQNA